MRGDARLPDGHRALAIGEIKMGKVRDGSGQIGVLPN
jgi:hypothetical protein